MDFPARQRYLIILAQCSRGIQYPTLAQLRTVCPHLTEKQLNDLYNAKGQWFFALPPTKVRGCVQIGEYYNTGNALFIARAYSECISHGPIPYQQEAIEYAEYNWPNSLTDDSWIDTLTIHVLDPSQFTYYGDHKHAYEIYLGLNREWYEIMADHHQPEWRSLDEAIAIATTDAFEGSEIRGGRTAYEEYNCAYCGGGISRKRCTGCSLIYGGTPLSWDIPLPPKLVELLKHQGHRFLLEPTRLYTQR